MGARALPHQDRRAGGPPDLRSEWPATLSYLIESPLFKLKERPLNGSPAENTRAYRYWSAMYVTHKITF
jgi:hypothetical protein